MMKLNMELIKQANDVLKNTLKWIEENKVDEIYSNYTDLKLHNINISSSEDIDTFNNFCEQEYNNMIEYFNDNYIDFDETVDRIGRTSSFYLNKINERDIYHTHTFGMKPNILDSLIFSYDFEYIFYKEPNAPHLEKGISLDLSYVDDIEEIERELKDFINSFENDVKETFDDSIKIRDYIEGFKENQVEIYKDYISFGYKEEEV